MDKTCEVAFYLDEAGPYLVRPSTGQKWTQSAKPWKVPSFWKTRGKVVVFGALKANPGKVYHHIDKNKGYKVMLKFIQRLANLYKHMSRIYLIWDNAKAHEAKRLMDWIKRWNVKGRVPLRFCPCQPIALGLTRLNQCLEAFTRRLLREAIFAGHVIWQMLFINIFTKEIGRFTINIVAIIS